VQIRLEAKRYHRGQTVNLKQVRPQSTRTLIARLEGASPVALNGRVGGHLMRDSLFIPEQTIPGTYKLRVTAEDIAHNIGTQEVQIEILP